MDRDPAPVVLELVRSRGPTEGDRGQARPDRALHKGFRVGFGGPAALDCRLLNVPGLHPFSERPVGMACEVEEARWDISPFRVSAPCALRVLGRGAPAGSV
jgi:hypothetical protein